VIRIFLRISLFQSVDQLFGGWQDVTGRCWTDRRAKEQRWEENSAGNNVIVSARAL